MFIEANGRIDALIKIFAFFPERSIKYLIKKKNVPMVSFFVIEGGASKKIWSKNKKED